METELVRRTDHEGVATIELHRPERKNAITGPLLDELAGHLRDAQNDSAVNAVLLCGAGGAFCSGLDLDEYRADPPRPWLATATESIQAAHLALASCEAPVVVALERYAINGGAAFVFGGDFVVAGETAWLQVGEVQMGIPAPMNLAWLAAKHSAAVVTRVVGRGDRLDAAELLRLGLIDERVADDEVRTRAEALAAQLAAYPAGANRQTKIAIRRAVDFDPEVWLEKAKLTVALPANFRP